ncbi:hypothetical protein BDD12DRAFT_884000 [Trichophaea hybrida]|nr:hypothetical protein BDD12DRAFT_884000 [Trichophaea hybrida]
MPKELTSIGRCEKRKGPDHVSETPAKKQKPSVSPSSVQAEIINKSYNVNPFSTNEQFLPHSQYTPSDLDWSIPSNPDTIVETFHSNVGLQRYGLPSNLPKTNRRFSSTMLPFALPPLQYISSSMLSDPDTASESFPGCSGRPWHAHDIPVTPHLLSAEVNGKPLSLPPLQCLWDKNPNNPDPIGPNTGDILPWQEVATTDNDSAEISRRTEWNTTTTDHMFDNVHDLDMNPDGWLVEEGTTDRHLTPSDFPSHNSPYANSNISCTNSSQTPVASIEQSSTETPTPSATGECANHDIEMTDAQTIAADSSQNTNSVSYEVCFGMVN